MLSLWLTSKRLRDVNIPLEKGEGAGLEWAIYTHFKIQAHNSWGKASAQSNCECKGAITFMANGSSKLPTTSLSVRYHCNE